MKQGYVFIRTGLLFLLFTVSFTFTFSQQYLVNSRWNATYGTDTSNYFYKKTTVKVDASMNVYTLGGATNATGHDFLLMKQNSSGDTLFIINWNGDGNGEDHALDMWIDNSTEYVYIVGGSYQNGTDSLDAVIVAFDNSGTELWHTYASQSGAYNDVFTSISTDGSSIFIVGGTVGTATQGYDYLGTTFDFSSGSEMYYATYDYGLDDVSVKTVYDPSTGWIYCAGISETSDTTWDYCIAEYKGYDWAYVSEVRNYAGTGQTHRPTDAIFTNGLYYITGGIKTGTDYNIKTVCLDTTLTVVWEQTWDGPDSMDDISSSIKVNSNGDVFITGRTGRSNWTTDMVTIKYDNAGNEQWVRYYDGSNGLDNDAGHDLELNGDNVYVTGYILSGGNYNTMCYDTAGNFRWQKISSAGGFPYPTDMAVDGDGNVIISAPLLYLFFTEKFDLLTVSDSLISDTSGIPICKKNEFIVKFNPEVIKTARIDDRDKVFGKLNDFVQDSTITKMSAKLGFDVSKVVDVIKIFKRFTTADSLSLSRLGDTIRLDKMWSTLLIKIPDTTSVFEWIDSLNTIEKDIFYAEADILMEFDAVPNDGLYSDQLNCYNSLDTTIDINVERAWDYETGRSNVKVGIYDSGIDWEHEDFSRDGSGTFNQSVAHNGYDYFWGTSITSSYTNADYLNHGTRVAGIIGSRRNNSIGVAGLAGGNGVSGSGVELYNMKINLGGTLIPISSSSISNAIYEGGAYMLTPGNYIGLGLNVANHSYGWKPNDTTFHNTTLKNAFYQSWRNGVVHCVSRGNETSSASQSDLDDIRYPANYNDNWMITVGAMGDDGIIANIFNSGSSTYYSMFGGTELDCVAPGVTTLVKQTTSNSSINSYTSFAGTSAAAPHVTGVAALMCSHYNDTINPYNYQNLVQDDIEHLISKYAFDKTTIVGWDDTTGWGLLDAEAIFNNIHRPQFEILHMDGLNPDATNSVIESANDTIWIENYDASGIGPGGYLVDRYVVTHTFNYTLPASYSFKDSWVLKSHAIGFGLPYPYFLPSLVAMNGNYWGEAEIVSSNGSQTIVKTRCYSIVQKITGTLQYYANTWLGNTNPGVVKMPFAIHIQNPTASIEDETENTIKIYPNPTNSIVNITGKDMDGLNYSLINIHGSVIRSGIINGSENFSLDIADLQSAIYFLRITDNAYIYKTIRIVKI